MTFAPIFVFIGDAFLCEAKRKEIIARLQKAFGDELSVTLRRAGEVPAESLLSEVRTLPFLAPAQVLCIRQADRFTKKELALWEAYFPLPHPQSFLIFEAESLERGHPFLDRAAKAKQLFFLKPQSGEIITRFIQEKLKQANKKIAGEALVLLKDFGVDSLLFLDSFLNHLLLAAGEKSSIERSDVEALETSFAAGQGPDLLDALTRRNVPQALKGLEELLEFHFRDFPSLVGLLHWQLRRLWEAKRCEGEGVGRREIAGRLGLRPPRAETFFKSVDRFSLDDIERILEGLFHLDWELKTGRAEGRFDVERWVVRTVGVSGRV